MPQLPLFTSSCTFPEKLLLDIILPKDLREFDSADCPFLRSNWCIKRRQLLVPDFELGLLLHSERFMERRLFLPQWSPSASRSRIFLPKANVSTPQFYPLLNPDRFLKQRTLLELGWCNLTRSFALANSSRTGQQFVFAKSLAAPNPHFDADSPPTTASPAGRTAW